MDTIVEKTKIFAQNYMEGNDPSHDWHHVERVRRYALYIAKCEIPHIEKKTLQIIEMAALLHDVGDHKYSYKNLKSQREILEEHFAPFTANYSKEIQEVIGIVGKIGFTYMLKNPDEPVSLEANIVRDSDLLESMGVIGIARTMMYSCTKNRSIVDSQAPYDMPINTETGDPLRPQPTYEEYKNRSKHANESMSHFTDKLLWTRKYLRTATAKRLGDSRHWAMVRYVFDMVRELQPLE